MKLRCYAQESFFFLTKPFHRSILSWVPVLPRQVTQNRDKLNFPRASQHHIDFTRLDHRWPLFFKTWITFSSYNLQNVMKWKKLHCKKLAFKRFSFLVSWVPEVVTTSSAYENARWRLTLLFTTSPVACNYLKNPLLYFNNLFMLSFSSMNKIYIYKCSIEALNCCLKVKTKIQAFANQQHHQGWENITRALYLCKEGVGWNV